MKKEEKKPEKKPEAEPAGDDDGLSSKLVVMSDTNNGL